MHHDEEPLLSDLCAICHINPLKYRCPRCQSRTCSLPCTKRHKLWSECSGVRDPGTYLKRSELSTPKAIDQDFNFITGIERTIERAGLDAEGRGIELRRRAPGRDNRGDAHWHSKGDVALMRAVERSGVIVDKAPKGLSRNRMNQTRWLQKSKQITWTVEWRTPEGNEIQHECPETFTLSTLYNNFQGSKDPRDQKAKKGKFKHSKSDNVPKDLTQATLHETSKTARDEQEAIADTITPLVKEEDKEKATEEMANPAELLPTEHERRNKPPEPDSPDQHVPSPSSSAKRPVISTPENPTLNFYLHRPHTPSSQPTILIPLPPSETLSSALRGRVVLEFPTIYVLNESIDNLRAGFVTEEEYLKAQKKEDLVFKTDGVEDEEELEEGEIDVEGIDEKKVLEVLRRDLGVM